MSDRPPPGEDSSPLYRFLRGLCRIVTTVVFDLKVYERHHVPRRGGALLIANHQSFLDPVLVAVQLYRPVSFLARATLFANPFFGRLLRKVHTFPVRLGEGDIGAIRQTIDRLNQGQLLNLFPEGTRTLDGELRPIAGGVALIVKRAPVPVIPVVVDGPYLAWPKGQRLPRPHRLRVLFGPALEVHGLKGAQVPALIEETFRRMLMELRAREQACPTR